MSVSESREMDDDARLRQLENEVEELQEKVGGNHVGAIYETMLERITELENEKEEMKKVIGRLCDECDVDVREVLYDEEDGDKTDVEEFL